MIGKVENGRRVRIETEAYAGLAGIEEKGGRTVLAFVPQQGNPAVGQAVTVEGKPFEIIETGYGLHVAALRTIVVKEKSQ